MNLQTYPMTIIDVTRHGIYLQFLLVILMLYGSAPSRAQSDSTVEAE